ncbi:MAG TPA: tagaturonate reductase [Chryseolinea sp.]
MKKLNRKNSSPEKMRPVKVLQFGEGNFLRAFVDWMVDILNEKTDFNGGVEIVQPINKGMAQALNDQDGLYHVVLKGIQNGKVYSETRLITCVSKATNPYERFQDYLTLGENPDLRFVISNTTESGIAFSPTDSNPAGVAETFPGKVTQLLFHRFKHFNGEASKGLIFLPCELIEKNGETLKKAILDYAELWKLGTEFIQWINNANTFCNTLVDRIVPGFPRDTIQEIQATIGFEDNLVVQAEPFHLWVIEGPSSVQKELPTAKAGLDVKFVADLSPYRTRKVRILNGAHTTLVPVAYLDGFRTVKESIDDPAIGSYIRKTISEEIIPTLDLPAAELKKFADDVIERFQNPFIKHELLSIALNSISKYKVRVLPSVLEYHRRTGNLPANLLYALAALIRFYKGEWHGSEIPLNDSGEVLDFFKQVWQKQDTEEIVQDVLANESFWGQDLNQVRGLADIVSKALKQIEKGVKVAAEKS